MDIVYEIDCKFRNLVDFSLLLYLYPKTEIMINFTGIFDFNSWKILIWIQKSLSLNEQEAVICKICLKLASRSGMCFSYKLTVGILPAVINHFTPIRWMYTYLMIWEFALIQWEYHFQVKPAIAFSSCKMGNPLGSGIVRRYCQILRTIFIALSEKASVPEVRFSEWVCPAMCLKTGRKWHL